MKHKLSTRAKELLLLIDCHCKKDWGTGDEKRFWVPSAYHQYITVDSNIQRNHDLLRIMGVAYDQWVSGAGDAASLKSLERKRLIEPRKLQKYAYMMTEEGRCVVEDLLNEARSALKGE